jgi:hypothetical protein
MLPKNNRLCHSSIPAGVFEQLAKGFGAAAAVGGAETEEWGGYDEERFVCGIRKGCIEDLDV